MRTPLLGAVLALAALSPAQQYVETFPFPDGPVPLPWTTQMSSWQIKSQRLVPASGSIYHYLTLNLFPSVTACVLDVDVIYGVTTGVQFGGLVARHPGGTGNVGQVYSKLQDNSSGGTLNSIWLYESLGGATSLTAGVITRAGTVRLIVKGRTAWTMVDQNMDGIFETVLPARPFSAAGSKDQGFVGLAGYGTTEMDNFKFFDAVLTEDPTTPPKIGTVYKMILTAEMNMAGPIAIPTPWLVGLSLGKAGMSISGNRAIPLSRDVMLEVSGSFSMSGILLNPGQDGIASLSIPNLPSLAGLRVFAAGITIDPVRPSSIGAISNDHSFVIVP